MSIHNEDKFHAKRKVFALGGTVMINDSNEQQVVYVKQKMFKLKEDVTGYTDESMSESILQIQARQILDFAAAYDIIDHESGEKVGALKRKGFKSIFKDEWLIMDNDDRVIARLLEDSGFGALLSRLISLIPQKYSIVMEETKEVVGKINQRFSFFVHNFDIDFSMDTAKQLNRTLGMASAILLLLIEGRQA